MEQILDIINEMSPYLLLGFLLAGLMHAFVPGKIYSRYLSRPNWRSVVNAALLGIPLPLCSCGVIPTAMSLRREGASKGATTSFLIATPQTGVDSIIATWSLMGLPFAILRPIAALCTALLGGQLVNLLDLQDPPKEELEEDEHCHDGHCHCDATKAERATSFGGKIVEALHYAFVDMMADIGKWLVIGLVVAGLITVFVPTSFFEVFAGNSLLSMLLVLCLAVPMYLCATGSIPIAVALMLKGLTPGAGLVMLMAGPASNVASILVIRKVLGPRTQMIYLVSIILGAVAFGLAIDHLLPTEWFVSSLVHHDACCHEETSWFRWCCTAVLCVLLANALLFPHNHPQEEHGTSLHIEGMNCNHCRAAVEKALRDVPGVEDVTVNLQSGEATVKGRADLDALRSAVESIGFSVKE